MGIKGNPIPRNSTFFEWTGYKNEKLEKTRNGHLFLMNCISVWSREWTTWQVPSILTPIVIDCQIHNTASFDVRFLTDNPFSLPMMTSLPGSIMARMLLAISSFLGFLFLRTSFLIPYSHLLIFLQANFFEFQTDADWYASLANHSTAARMNGNAESRINLITSLSLLFSAFKLISSSSISWKAFLGSMHFRTMYMTSMTFRETNNEPTPELIFLVDGVLCPFLEQFF